MPKRKASEIPKWHLTFQSYPCGPSSCLSITIPPNATHRSMFAALEKEARMLEKNNDDVSRFLTQLQCMRKGKLAYRIHYNIQFADGDSSLFDRIFQPHCVPYYPHYYMHLEQNWFSSLSFSYNNDALQKEIVVDSSFATTIALQIYPLLKLEIQCLTDIMYLTQIDTNNVCPTMTPKRKMILMLLQKWVSQDIATLISEYGNNDVSEFLSQYARFPVHVNPLYYHFYSNNAIIQADQWESNVACVNHMVSSCKLNTRDYSVMDTFFCHIRFHPALPKPQCRQLEQCPPDWTFGWFVIWNEIIYDLFDCLLHLQSTRYRKESIGLRISSPHKIKTIKMYSARPLLDAYRNQRWDAAFTYLSTHCTFEDLFPFDPKIHGPKWIPLIFPLVDLGQEPLSIALRDLKPSEWVEKATLLPKDDIDWMTVNPTSIETTIETTYFF